MLSQVQCTLFKMVCNALKQTPHILKNSLILFSNMLFYFLKEPSTSFEVDSEPKKNQELNSRCVCKLCFRDHCYGHVVVGSSYSTSCPYLFCFSFSVELQGHRLVRHSNA